MTADLAANARHRIKAALQRRGLWRPEHSIAVEQASESVAAYVALAQELPADDPTVQTCRVGARQWLVQLCLIDASRAHLSPLDAAGIDAELLALVQPPKENT